MTPRQELRRGWPVIAAAFCGISTGVLTFPFLLIGPQMHSLRGAFGWSDTAIAACGTFLSAGLALGTPIAGRLLDTISARWLALASMLLLAALLASLSRIGPQIGFFYLAYFAIGLLAAGAGITTYTRALGTWFSSARGLAFGIALSGSGVTVFFVPFLANSLQQQFDWRAVYIGTAAIVLFALPLVALGLRSAPEGHQIAHKPVAAPVQAKPPHFWRTVIFDRYFISIAVALGLLGTIMGSTAVRIVPMLLDVGYSPDAAARTASALGIALIFGRVGMGWLVDRLSAAYLAAASFLLAAAGCAIFVLGPAFAIFPIVAIGIMWGAEYDLVSYLTMQRFGLRHYGSIYSIFFSIYVITNLISPFFVGFLVDQGGYVALILVNAAIYLMISIVFWLLARTAHSAKRFVFAE